VVHFVHEGHDRKKQCKTSRESRCQTSRKKGRCEVTRESCCQTSREGRNSSGNPAPRQRKSQRRIRQQTGESDGARVSQQKYLLDTNIFIEYFRRTAKVVRFLESLNVTQITLSAVSYLEFVQGEVRVGRGRDRTVADTVGRFHIEPLTTEMALLAGQRALKLNRDDMNDLAIAATAVKLQRTLVTYNVRDFKGFTGLRLKTVDDLLK
jgi:predicted nucleic acid-binding protein